MGEYEDSILAQYSTPGLKRNSLETKELTSGSDKPNTNIIESGNILGAWDDPFPETIPHNAVAPVADPTSTSLRALARCLGCGQDLFYCDAPSGWYRGLRHRDGTWVCGLPDRPGERVETRHQQTPLDDGVTGD